ATVAGERLFGKAIKRREDPRFITGRGQYVDDVKLPGMTYAAFVRSQHAHAKIRRIDASAALKHPGVVAVFTGKDMTGVNSRPWTRRTRSKWIGSRCPRSPRPTRPREPAPRRSTRARPVTSPSSGRSAIGARPTRPSRGPR